MSALERRRWSSTLLVLCVSLLVVGLVSASPRADGPVVRLGGAFTLDLLFGQVASPGAVLLLAVIALFI